ncbi:MAG: PQQ-like beta-propeller repeat protein, partial [Planctomycetes bacterium]|nr:PQQ-like beta-propeller repeat protein [Planctomycetota bacterium]
PDAPGTLAGRKGKWVDLLEQLRKSVAATGPSVPRNDQNAVPADVGAPYWSLPLNGPGEFDAEPVSPESDVDGLAFYPRLWNGLVFWNARDWIVGYNVHSGLGAWLENEPQSAQHWREQGHVFPIRADPFDFQPDRPVHGFLGDDLTIHEGKLFARMAGPITACAERENRVPPSRLVCLDLQEGQGRLVWDLDATQLDPNLRFEGPPVAKDNRLWVLARRGLAPSELYLLCLSADTGKFLWNRLICSNSARAPEGANLASSLRIVSHESTLVISTELGCVAALNTEDGQPIWYRIYPRQMELNGATTSPQLSPGCIIHEGVVYAAPDDSDQLLALDLLTGETIWSQTRPADHRVWGVAQDRVITSGKTLEARHVADGQLEWQFSAPVAELQGRGDGLVTDDQIWWPTPTQILVFQAKDGGILKTIDLHISRHLQGGNLAANRKELVIASPDRVTVLSPWGQMPVKKNGE